MNICTIDLMKKNRSKTFTITAEMDIPNDHLYSTVDADLITELLGQWIKVKSGLYENIAMGVITNVAIVEQQQTPRKPATTGSVTTDMPSTEK